MAEHDLLGKGERSPQTAAYDAQVLARALVNGTDKIRSGVDDCHVVSPPPQKPKNRLIKRSRIRHFRRAVQSRLGLEVVEAACGQGPRLPLVTDEDLVSWRDFADAVPPSRIRRFRRGHEQLVVLAAFE